MKRIPTLSDLGFELCEVKYLKRIPQFRDFIAKHSFPNKDMNQLTWNITHIFKINAEIITRVPEFNMCSNLLEDMGSSTR